MTTRRHSKRSKIRGTRNCCWGSKKRHRGAGHRGGRGNAGSGKMGDCKSPIYVRIKDYFGKHGFTSKSRSKVCPVNVGYLNDNLDSLIAEKMIEKKGDVYHINGSKLGFTKLLSKGQVRKKMEITVDCSTEKAVSKIEAAGGKVISSAIETKVMQKPVENKIVSKPKESKAAQKTK